MFAVMVSPPDTTVFAWVTDALLAAIGGTSTLGCLESGHPLFS